jgi:hypothetical protein
MDGNQRTHKYNIRYFMYEPSDKGMFFIKYTLPEINLAMSALATGTGYGIDPSKAQLFITHLSLQNGLYIGFENDILPVTYKKLRELENS